MPWLWSSRLRRLKNELLLGSLQQKLSYVREVPHGVSRLAKPLLVKAAFPLLPQSLRVKWAGATVPTLLSKSNVRKQNAKFKKELFEYLEKIASNPNFDKFVLMFSGTIYIQEKRANRPIRLTRVFIDDNVPVLFSYFRRREDEPIPPNYDERLFQSPIDKTMEFMRHIIRFNFGDKEKIFVFSFPYPPGCRFINEFNAHGWQTIYDVRDDWEEFCKIGMATWYDNKSEMYAVNNCDVTTCVSRPLQKKLQAFTKAREVRLCRNAYDINFLKTGEVGVAGASADGKTIGYFGHLTDRWFDWDFVVKLAKAKPEWTIELIGHQTPRRLRLPKNIKYLGFLGHEEICQIASRWKCAIIPFKLTKLAEGVDPIKIYEYLALGLPTVSVTMPQIAEYPYTCLAQTLEGFVKCVEGALNTTPDPEVIREWLSENTWEKRVQEIYDMASSVDTDVPLKHLCGTNRTVL